MSLPGDQVSVSVVPRTHAKIGIEEALIKFKVGKTLISTADEVKSYIQELLNEALEITITEVEKWINRFVPKRSGDLRESLKHFLKKSVPPESTIGELRGIRLILGSGAEVKYARYVVDMTTKQLRHSSTWREHSGKKAYSKGKPILLHDPQAVGEYHDKMVAYAKERLYTNLDKSTYKFNSSG